jgi:predicted dehydrogenase
MAHGSGSPGVCGRLKGAAAVPNLLKRTLKPQSMSRKRETHILSSADTRGDLRVGLIGYGLAGEVFHAPLIAATPGLTLAAIVTANDVRRARAAERYPDARLVADSDALFARASDLDVVVIASPNRTHVSLASAAMAAGLSVVVDKPLAATAAEARRLIEEAGQRRTLLTVFQNRRWDGDFLTVQRLLGEGQFGNVLRYESRFERWRPVVKPGWRMLDAPEEAGGLLYDLGSHLIDQALVLFGPVSQVYAELDRRRPGVSVDDDAFVALRHHSGVRSHLWMSAVAGQLGPRFRILGDRGAFTKFGLDPQEPRLAAGADPAINGWSEEPPSAWGEIGAGDEQLSVRTEPGAYLDFYARLVESVRDAAPPPVDPRDAVATLTIVEAAQQSAARGEVVQLP